MSNVYESTAMMIVKKKSKETKDLKTIKEVAINVMMRWMYKPDRKKVELAVDKAMKKLQIDESKVARKPDMLISHK